LATLVPKRKNSLDTGQRRRLGYLLTSSDIGLTRVPASGSGDWMPAR